MSDTYLRLGFVSLQVLVLHLQLVFMIDAFQQHELTLLLPTGCSQAEYQGYGDQSLDCCTAPSPADVVKEESGKAGAKKAANSKGCRPVGRGDFCSFQKKSSELFEHWDAPIIYRYKHFLLCMTLSMRSLKGGTLSNFGAEYQFF